VAPRWLWQVSPAIVFGAAFVVLTRFVRQNPVIPGEISVDRAVTARAPTNLIDLSHAVDIQVWVLVVLALVVCLLLARRFREALLLLLAEPLADGLNLALKIAVNRQFGQQVSGLEWNHLGVLLFPSGHVVRTTVTLGLLVCFVAWPQPRLRWPATLAALAFIGLVGLTQVAVGGHLPLDVVGSFLLGSMLVNVVYVVDRGWARRLGLSEPISPSTSVRAVGTQAQRALPAAGLAIVLLMLAVLGLRAPQRVWHLAAQPTAATLWPRTLVADAEHGASSAREWVARAHDRLRGSS
jgi:membrane-associated phospholipid phosphatase